MDNLTVKMKPLMKFATVVGILAGLAIVGMGIARMRGAIDMGPEFEGIKPLWMVGGGVAIAIGFAIKLSRFNKLAGQAQERLDNK